MTNSEIDRLCDYVRELADMNLRDLKTRTIDEVSGPPSFEVRRSAWTRGDCLAELLSRELESYAN